MFLMWICHYKWSWCALLTHVFMLLWFQVQLQEETLEEDKARPVNMRVRGSQPPSISTSARTSSCWARPWGGSHVIWSSSRFVQTLWLCSCLTIKDQWSNLNDAMWLFSLPPSKCLSNIYLQAECFSKENQTLHGKGYCWRSSAEEALWRVFNLLTTQQILINYCFMEDCAFFPPHSLTRVGALLHVSKTTLKFKKPNFNTKTNLYI